MLDFLGPFGIEAAEFDYLISDTDIVKELKASSQS